MNNKTPKSKKYGFACLISLGIMINANTAQAWSGDKLSNDSCQFGFDASDNSAHLYVNTNQVFFVKRIEDARYGDTEEVYDALTCKQITSGVASKSNFATVMTRNNFEEISLKSTGDKQYVNRDFSMFIELMKMNGKIKISITKPNTEQQQALNQLNARVNSSDAPPLSDSNIKLLATDSLLQKMLNLKGNADVSMRKMTFLLALQDSSSTQNISALSGIDKGQFDDYYPLASNGNLNALRAAFITAENEAQFRRAELLLINQIKNKLFSFNANVTGGSTELKNWNESRLFGRTTDESKVTAKNTIAYKSSINTALYNPKNSFTVKAKLIATIDYNGSSSSNYETTLITHLGGGRNTDSGTATVEWIAARVGAGSFMKQNYRFKDYNFKIIDVTVE